MTVEDLREVVAAKRDGRKLPEAEIRAFVEGYTQGRVSDGLAAAFLMASLLRGLDAEETLALTRTMVESGDTVSFRGLDRPTVPFPCHDVSEVPFAHAHVSARRTSRSTVWPDAAPVATESRCPLHPRP